MKKKILALALSAVMMLGLSTTAFATSTNGGDGTTDMSEVHIVKTYQLNGSGSSPAETFTVALDNSNVVTGDAESAPALGTITGAYFAAGAANAAGVTADIVINLPIYDQVGVYEYYLHEVDNDTTGVTYGNSTASSIKLVVTVINGDDGNVRIGAVHTETITYDEETGEVTSTKTDGITNTYTANSLSVTKEVDGNLGDTTKAFSFEVTFTNPTGNGTWVNNITLPTGATLKEGTTSTYTFTLIAGATATFGNIPDGVEYTVTETDYSSDGYITYTTYDAKDSTKNVKGREVEGTMDSDGESVTITNVKEQTVDTGINLDSLPYIMILAIVLLGAAYVIIRRRVSDRY